MPWEAFFTRDEAVDLVLDFVVWASPGGFVGAMLEFISVFFVASDYVWTLKVQLASLKTPTHIPSLVYT
jgi:hypothetical protein